MAVTMIDSLTSLRLKPVTTYSDYTGKKTTITSFEDMLTAQKLSDDGKTAVGEVGQESSTVHKTEGTQQLEEDAKAAAEITFRDPSTGANVQYVDVAKPEEKENAVASSSKSHGTDTTSASSMKKTKYDAYFKKAALKYHVSESLLKAIAKAESNFNAKDVSSAGAIGVMQLMPATADGLGVTDPYDPEQNIMGGAKCISQKLKEFNGDVRLALAAYNAGSGAVKRYGGVPSYCKTYVNRVLSYKEAYETASAVG